MAGIRKEPGPTARRVADAINRIRRGNKVTTAQLSRRLAALGQPIPDTGITKTEQGTRRVDVDDLVPIALALGVTPNTLLMPQIGYLGAMDPRDLTPKISGRAEELWQWAQGEKPLRLPIPGACSWLGGEHPDLEFSIRCRPYLTALHAPGRGAPGERDPRMIAVAAAVHAALEAGATGLAVRRTVELTIALPAVMTKDEIGRWLEDGTRPDGEGA
jgi:hypothetical protein